MTRVPLWFVAAVTIAVLVLIASVGVTWTAQRSLSDRADRDDQRDEIIDAARQYFVASNTYDFTRVKEYRGRLEPLMTEQNLQEFDKTMGQIAEGFAAVEAQAVGKVREAAVEVLDADSSTVMVTGDVEFDSTRLKSTSHPRWEITLRQVDGEWLVAEHTELGDDRIFTPTGPAGG